MSQIKIKVYALDKPPVEVHRSLCKLDSEWPTIHKKYQVEKGFIQVLASGKNIIGYVVVKHNDESSAHIHKLFIHPSCRRKSFGRQLLLRAMHLAAKNSYDELYVECEEVYLPFFASQGFIMVREPGNTPHYHMEMPNLRHYLDIRAETVHQDSDHDQVLKLGKDSHLYKFSSQAKYIDFHRSMLAQAQRQVSILADTILHPIFKEDYIRQCLLNLSKRNAQARIKILLIDDRTGAGYHNPLIDLAQKLTSFVEVRVIPRGASRPTEMITTVDFGGGIYRKDLDNYAGFVNYSNHLIAQRLRDNFDQHWQYAKPSANMRRLSI